MSRFTNLFQPESEPEKKVEPPTPSAENVEPVSKNLPAKVSSKKSKKKF